MIKTLILGIVQGLSEFLPISSSGHLVLLQKLFGMESTGVVLEVLLHVGTLVAVLVVFWRDWLDMLLHPLKSKALRLLVVATIPAVIVALLCEEAIERAFTGWFLGVSFLITAALMLLSDAVAERAPKPKENAVRGVAGMRYPSALAMGLMQAVAVLPGVSRSGATIFGGLASGVSRRTSAKFSFMMSAVAIVGSLVFKIKDLVGMPAESIEGGWVAVVLGMVAAGVSGYLAIRWMLRLIQRVSLKWFGLYTGLLGLLVLADQLFFGVFFEKLL